MRRPAPPPFALLAVLALALAASTPAAAQRTADLPGRQAPVALTDAPGGLSLGKLFNAETLKLGHSYELSYGSGPAGGVGLGVFTSSLRWQPSAKLAGRVDVGVAHSPFGSAGVQSALGFDGASDVRVFLRNAELAYRPTENMTFQLRVQQSPHGTYGSPYGYGRGYGYGAYGYGPGAYGRAYGRTGFSATFAPSDGDALFFRDGR
ncbi:hypothetical protein [Rubrivirga litoralis]|uniref:Uncharacterized protein n=1 Tax=Rubrivirga litoralis TaxID=3075598 RepID=A0ABU3BLX9_9BACT|nr:hypothetical protein [Rubrivirga sp. F394]MDT0630294.1 hypothetical protein [Rubrivirga sp. F394]